MTDHASELRFLFLRAINTGGRRLTNDELLAPLVDAGFADAMAYQAAGNIAFNATTEQLADAPDLERLLTDAYGFDTPVFVRTEPQLRSVLERCPFTDADLAATSGKVQVTFLDRAATAAQIDEVEALTPSEDRVAFDDTEWFWLPLDGVSTSMLPVPKIERIVGPMTMRTLGTLERMIKKFC